MTKQEYKAEIERLKNANSELVDNLVFYKDKSYKLEKNVDKLKTDIKQEVKQAQIDVLNKVNGYINNKIESDYGDMSDSVNYLTIDIEDFDDFIDELIKEVQK